MYLAIAWSIETKHNDRINHIHTRIQVPVFHSTAVRSRLHRTIWTIHWSNYYIAGDKLCKNFRFETAIQRTGAICRELESHQVPIYGICRDLFTVTPNSFSDRYFYFAQSAWPHRRQVNRRPREREEINVFRVFGFGALKTMIMPRLWAIIYHARWWSIFK